MKFWNPIGTVLGLDEPTETPARVKPVIRPTRPTAPAERKTARPSAVSAVSDGSLVPDTPHVPEKIPADTDVLASVMEQSAAATTTKPAEVRKAVAHPPKSKLDRKAQTSWDLPGFERRCRVSTIFGELPIEALRRRDKVKTLSGAFREVLWIDEIRLDADFMTRHPEAHPIHLRARALGGAQPVRSMLVSPGQVIHATALIGNIGTGPAAKFDGYPSITQQKQTEITYYRFHCGEPETVCIEGAWFCVSP